MAYASRCTLHRPTCLAVMVLCITTLVVIAQAQTANGANRHRVKPGDWAGSGHEPRRWGESSRCADAACKGRKDHAAYNNVHLYGERWTAAGSASLLTSDFMSGTDGWEVVNSHGGSAGWAATSDAGGLLSSETDTHAADTWYFRSPSSWAGDRSSSYNGRLTYTLAHKSFNDNGAAAAASGCAPNRDCHGDSDIVLEAQCGYSLVKRGAWSASSGVSSSITVTLNEDAGWRDTRTGKKAGLFDFLGTLSHLKAVWIRGSYYSGKEVVRLSAVSLSAGKKWEPCCTLDDTVDICHTKGNRYFNPSNLKFYCEGSQANVVRVTSVFPRYGRRTGGSSITVEGLNFGQDGTTPIVRVGGRPCKKTYYPTHQPVPAVNSVVRESMTNCLTKTCTINRVYLDEGASAQHGFYVGMMIKLEEGSTYYRRIVRSFGGQTTTISSSGATGTKVASGATFTASEKYVEFDEPLPAAPSAAKQFTIYYVPPAGNAWRARPIRATNHPVGYDSSSFTGYDSRAHASGLSRHYFHSGTAQAHAQPSAKNQIKLATTASAVDDFYNGKIVYLHDGAGYMAGGVTRTIVDYVGSTRLATVDRAWELAPSETDLANAFVPDTTTDYFIINDGGGDELDLTANAATSRGPEQHTRLVCVTPEFQGEGQPFDVDVTVEAAAGGREGPFRVQALGHGRTGTRSGRFATTAVSCINEESRGFQYGEHDFSWSLHMRLKASASDDGDIDTSKKGETFTTDMAIDYNTGDIYTVGYVKGTHAAHFKLFYDGLHVHKGFPLSYRAASVSGTGVDAAEVLERLWWKKEVTVATEEIGFIAKFSKLGEPLWTTYATSAHASAPHLRFESVSVDATGNTGGSSAATADIYVGGKSKGVASFLSVKKTDDRKAGRDRPMSSGAVSLTNAAGGALSTHADSRYGFVVKYDGAGQVVLTNAIYNADTDAASEVLDVTPIIVRSYRASMSHIINDYENGGVYVSGQVKESPTVSATDFWVFGNHKPEYQNGGIFACDVRVNAVTGTGHSQNYEGSSADCNDDNGLSPYAGFVAKYDKNLKVDWVRSMQNSNEDLSAPEADSVNFNKNGFRAGSGNRFGIRAMEVHGDVVYVTGIRDSADTEDGQRIVTKAISTRVTGPDAGLRMGQRGKDWLSQPNWKRHEQGVVAAQTNTGKVAIDLDVTQPATDKGNPRTQAIGRPGWLIRVKGNPEGWDMDDITAASTNQDNVYTVGPPHPGTGGTNFGDNVRRITAVTFSGTTVTYTVDSAFEKAPTCTTQNMGGLDGTSTVTQPGKEKVCDLYELWDPQPWAYEKWSMEAGEYAATDARVMQVTALAFGAPELAPPALRGNWHHWENHQTLLGRHQPRDNSAPHDVRSENSFSDPASPGAFVYIGGTFSGSGVFRFCHYDLTTNDKDQSSVCARTAFPAECVCTNDRCQNDDGNACSGALKASNTGGDTTTDLFIAKYAAADGSLLWVKRTGEPQKSDTLTSLAVDWKTGGVYVTGSFTGGSTVCGNDGSSCGVDTFGLVADGREDELGCPMDVRPEESCYDTANWGAEMCLLRSRGKPWCKLVSALDNAVTGYVMKLTDGVREGRTGAVAQRGRVKATSHGSKSATSNCYVNNVANNAATRVCNSDGVVWARTLGTADCESRVSGTDATACKSAGQVVRTHDTDVYVLGEFTHTNDLEGAVKLRWSALRTPGVDDYGFFTYDDAAQDGVLFKLED